VSSITTRTIEMREGTCTAVALVGPTGVGKTTTLAKLAAAATQVEHRRVAFITLDCYRLGAVEQLETYAHLLAVPLRVAYSAQELQELRRTYEDYDLVLIDTVGRSPQNRLQLEEMAGLLEAAELQEVHLVMDAGASAAKHESVVHGFLPQQPTHLLLSKLDEAPRIEDSLISALNSGLPLSYLTTGQRVPEDLAPADPTQLHRWLCGGV
jgi:flagellar biosynthesis protein FlhF